MKKITIQKKDFFLNLLISFRDKRAIVNAENIVSKIISEKSIQLWSISDDKKEYEKFHNLINGNLVNVLDVNKMNENLLTRIIHKNIWKTGYK